MLPLHWRQEGFKASIICLEPGTTKNDDGRTLAMAPELRATLEARRVATESLRRKRGRIIPCVFHRNGKLIKGFSKAWHSACPRADSLTASLTASVARPSVTWSALPWGAPRR